MSSFEERFWSKVDVRGPDECWPWTRATNEGGYGILHNPGGSSRAHRVSWSLAHDGAVPVNDVDHACHNSSGCTLVVCPHRRCVNPAHLEDVTRSVNLRRGNAGGKRGHRLQSCPEGHAYAEHGGTRRGDGSFYCRLCQRDRARARAKAKVAC